MAAAPAAATAAPAAAAAAPEAVAAALPTAAHGCTQLQKMTRPTRSSVVLVARTHPLAPAFAAPDRVVGAPIRVVLGKGQSQRAARTHGREREAANR